MAYIKWTQPKQWRLDAGCIQTAYIQTAYRKREMKELDGSSFLFKAVEVDKPLVLFTSSF